MTQYILGLDGGGSKTSAVIIDENGKILGKSIRGSSNYHLVSRQQLKTVLKESIQAAAANAKIQPSQLSAATWALAGVGRPTEKKAIQAIRAEILPKTKTEIVTDALAALVGGTGERKGIVVISGTGAIAYGEDGAGKTARAGGWGHALDYGSGYSIAQEALRSIVRAIDGSDMPTLLHEKMQKTLGISNTEELINWLYAPQRKIAEVALLAPQVLSAAEEGDLIATDILLQAAESLARAAKAVARRLRLQKKPFPLVLSGGLLQNNDFYRRLVSQSIRTQLPTAHPHPARKNAAMGAALLARERLGYPLTTQKNPQQKKNAVWASEERNILTLDLDLYPSLTVAGLMHLEDKRAVAAVRDTLPEIARAIDDIAKRMKQGGRLIYVGAGTSGRLGTLDASECPPTFGTDPKDIFCIMAGGEKALTQAFEGAEDNQEAGKQEIAANRISKKDSVVGIAASGRTPFVIGALQEARRRGALTAAIICNIPAPMAKDVDHLIAPLVGPEALAGSTRLKAGTAQKLVLNMLSTGVMIRLGKTYGNLMVDVAQHNIKLQERAERIVSQACNVDKKTAANALNNAEKDIRTAIIQLKLGCKSDTAKQYLAQTDRNIRLTLEKKQK